MKTVSIKSELGSNEYPGRGIILVKKKFKNLKILFQFRLSLFPSQNFTRLITGSSPFLLQLFTDSTSSGWIS